MTTALYVMADEYLEAARRLADLNLPDEVVADTLEGLAGAIEVKATNVAMFIRNIEANAEAIKMAESQMAFRRKAVENRAKRVREYLQAQMERSGITQIDCPYFKMSVRDNPAAVVIDAESQIPQEYMRTPEPPPPMPDKKAIADAIKAGVEVPGAHLQQGKRLEIK